MYILRRRPCKPGQRTAHSLRTVCRALAMAAASHVATTMAASYASACLFTSCFERACKQAREEDLADAGCVTNGFGQSNGHEIRCLDQICGNDGTENFTASPTDLLCDAKMGTTVLQLSVDVPQDAIPGEVLRIALPEDPGFAIGEVVLPTSFADGASGDAMLLEVNLVTELQGFCACTAATEVRGADPGQRLVVASRPHALGQANSVTVATRSPRVDQLQIVV
eukprot:SAG22_NODE_355_length_11775_cov_76.400651_4_plen_224_part_00